MAAYLFSCHRRQSYDAIGQATPPSPHRAATVDPFAQLHSPNLITPVNEGNATCGETPSRDFVPRMATPSYPLLCQHS